MKPHKWAKEIKAWADGAEIETRYCNADGWTKWKLEKGGFIWYQGVGAEYRIKLQPKEPQYLYVWQPYDEYNEAFFTFRKPESILDDGVYKYIGKIKLEDE